MSTHNSVMVVGSSGFLGRQVMELLTPLVNVVPTHCYNRSFPTSIHYDFFKDDIRDTLNQLDVSIVIFTASVERKPTTNFQASMDRFSSGCGDRRIIYVSSAAVFDGISGQYTEDDIPAPQSLYGRNLLLSEKLIREHCPNSCIIRPCYIYGYSNEKLDKRLSRTCKALSAGEEVLLFNDMYKSPLGVRQVAEAVIYLSLSEYIGILHVAGERLNVFDFHYQAMETLGVNTNNLRPCSMPSDGGFLKDTSLCSSHWQQLSGMKPLSVQETLAPKSALTPQWSGPGGLGKKH